MNCYNGETYLKEAIDSIYSQTYQNWEIIFIDNCSTDNSAKITKSYDSRLKYYKTEKNVPLGHARNFGLTFVNGDYLAFLDTDDIWIDNKLSLQIELLESNKNYAYCYSDYELIDESSKHISFYKVKNKDGHIFKDLLLWYDVGMPTITIRKSILDKFDDKFDTSLRFCPDYDLFMRIAMNYEVCSIKEVLCKYRISSNSLTKQTQGIKYNEVYFVSKKLLNIMPDIISLYPQEYNHWQTFISKEKADSMIFNGDLYEARKYLKKASSLGPRHQKRYEMSLLENGLELLQKELKEISG
jgi:glycosyltransferase involved in cell wall biosynthesis